MKICPYSDQDVKFQICLKKLFSTTHFFDALRVVSGLYFNSKLECPKELSRFLKLKSKKFTPLKEE